MNEHDQILRRVDRKVSRGETDVFTHEHPARAGTRREPAGDDPPRAVDILARPCGFGEDAVDELVRVAPARHAYGVLGGVRERAPGFPVRL